MKKLLIGLFAASLLAASAVGYAGSVTFVNSYNQPVAFVVSAGAVYNPIVAGTVPAGARATFPLEGPLTPDMNFLAWAPQGSNIVSNCGQPVGPVDHVTVRAGFPNGYGPGYGYNNGYGYNGGPGGPVGAVGDVFGAVGFGSTGSSFNCTAYVTPVTPPAEVTYVHHYKHPCHLHHNKVVYSPAQG
jgi:hypothetical protein